MPTTEVPTSPPGQPPEKPLFRRKHARYEELEPDELLHLIDRLEDERSLARRREGIWISVIAHLIVFWFILYGPRVLWHEPHVVNPELQNRKDMTYLDLPPDALKNIKPKPQAPLSDKNRTAQAPHPTLDRKTLRDLQAMRPAGPPAPVPPQPQRQAPQPAPTQQQAQAQPQRVAPAPPPIKSTQQSPVEAPKPAPTPPNFNNGPQTAGDAIRQAEQNAANNRGQSSGDYGQNAPSGPAIGPDIEVSVTLKFGASPVVPQTTSAVAPLFICRSQSRSKASPSNSVVLVEWRRQSRRVT